MGDGMGNDQGFPGQGAMGRRAGGWQVMGGDCPTVTGGKHQRSVRTPQIACVALESVALERPPRAAATGERTSRRKDYPAFRVPTRPDHAIFVRTPNTLDRSPQLCPRETVAAQSQPPKNVADAAFPPRSPLQKVEERLRVLSRNFEASSGFFPWRWTGLTIQYYCRPRTLHPRALDHPVGANPSY